MTYEEFKQVGVVLLSTNKEPELGCICVRLGLQIWNGQFDKPHHNQHLYLTSNEEIKFGDWYYDNEMESINKSSYPNELPPFLKRRCFKVIASTDKSLGLPSISDKDLQDYTKSYNEGNIIIEWEVEMTATPDNSVIINNLKKN